MSQVHVGAVLYGFCGGVFGLDSYHDKRVEAVGADWVVVRAIGYDDGPKFYRGDPAELEEYTEPDEGG